jgi:hypothetical protein
VLDAGLGVLSLAAGPVLGAFLIGVLAPSVKTGPMLAGMVAGIAGVTLVWWSQATAWTWYAFIGVAVTSLGALAAQAVSKR